MVFDHRWSFSAGLNVLIFYILVAVEMGRQVICTHKWSLAHVNCNCFLGLPVILLMLKMLNGCFSSLPIQVATQPL